MIAAWMAFFDAVLALSLVIVGVGGAHFGFVYPFLGFSLFIFGALIGVLGLLFGLVGVLTTRGNRSARNRAWYGVIVGLALTAILAALYMHYSGYPLINDITTDFDDPPEFVNATLLLSNKNRDMGYNKTAFAGRQLEGYGKLASLPQKGDADSVFRRVVSVARSTPRWYITRVDTKTHSLEGVAITRIFSFQDDFVIQVRTAAGGCVVAMRSKSRDGIGDLGTNFRRIKSFFARLQELPAGS